MGEKSKKDKSDKHKKHKKKEKREKTSKRKRDDSESSEDEGVQAEAEASKAQAGQLSEDDYFVRNPEFSSWLVAERGKFFNQLSSDESRELFAKFVERWNSKKLPAKYYAGVTAPAGMRRTGHNWGFKTSAAEESRGIGMAAAIDDEAAEKSAGRQAERQEQKRWRRDQKDLLDEMLPKSTGREAMLEKKAARREAARERESSPVIDRLPGGGGDLMGGEDSSAAARAREQARTQRQGVRQAARQENLTARTSAVAASEDAAMASFRALIAKGPIAIPKRQ